jgi:ketosteroid isomerase-like protein
MTDWSRDTERAMSQENVEIVRQLFQLWERGEWGDGREFYDDGCEVVFSTSWFPDAGIYGVGHEALGAWMAFVDAFEELAVGLDQVVDAGERVVALVSLRARGRASGAAVDAKVGAVFTFRDRKVVRWEMTDRGDALEAAGLSE